MFDIGFWELLLIMVLAMIVIGPEKLPGAARTAGRWVGKARRFVEGVKTEVAEEFDVTELKRMIHNQEVQLGELSQKLKNPKILDDELETLTSSVYSIEDDVIEDSKAEVDKSDVDKSSVDNSADDKQASATHTGSGVDTEASPATKKSDG